MWLRRQQILTLVFRQTHARRIRQTRRFQLQLQLRPTQRPTRQPQPTHIHLPLPLPLLRRSPPHIPLQIPILRLSACRHLSYPAVVKVDLSLDGVRQLHSNSMQYRQLPIVGLRISHSAHGMHSPLLLRVQSLAGGQICVGSSRSHG